MLYKIRNFLKKDECANIIKRGAPKLERSKIMGRGKDYKAVAYVNQYRTSFQAWLECKDYDDLKQLDDRVQSLTRINKTHTEMLQVLRYREGEYYGAHIDQMNPQTFADLPPRKREIHQKTLENWEYGHKNRFATVFWYLNTVAKEHDGGTAFLRSDGHSFDEEEDNSTEFCRNPKILKIQPEEGTVLLWYTLFANGASDPDSMHGACPILAKSGEQNVEKWAANYWLLNKPFRGRVETMPDYRVDLEDASAKEREDFERLEYIVKRNMLATGEKIGKEVELWQNEDGSFAAVRPSTRHVFQIPARKPGPSDLRYENYVPAASEAGMRQLRFEEDEEVLMKVADAEVLRQGLDDVSTGERRSELRTRGLEKDVPNLQSNRSAFYTPDGSCREWDGPLEGASGCTGGSRGGLSRKDLVEEL